MGEHRPRPASERATTTCLRWTGIAITAMQLVYVTGTLISEHTTGIVTPYRPQAVIVMLTTMILLAAINIIRLIWTPKQSSMAHLQMAIYYASTVLFCFCVANEYRDGVIALLWTILLATTGILYGHRAYFLGILIMVASTALSPIVIHYTLDHIIALIIVMILAIYTSSLFFHYRQIGLIELRDYNLLKRRERLQTRRLRAVVNNLKDALVSVSPEGTIQLYNSAALNLLNTNRDIIGMNADKLFNLIDENGDRVKLSSITAQVTTATERKDLRMSYGEGQVVCLRLDIIPIKRQFTTRRSRRHDVDGVIIMASDITKEKSLDDERDEFIGVVSHELRTPVAIAEGAISNLQLLLERNGDPHLFATTLDAAHKQILYLGQMVNDLATLSRAQRGLYMNDEEIDIRDFVTSLYNKYDADARARHLRLIADIQVDGKVIVPSMVIEEIMQNLITNALKYTEHGSVVIGVNKVPGDSNHAKFYVKDSGIGISKSDMKHIFQRFWRSEDYRTRKTSGTGLGLHVVDQLATKIGCKVTVTSQLNVGSTFSIVLPIRPDQPKAK